jgi:hypothetical protein
MVMIDWNLSTTQLVGIWLFAGLLCMMPLLWKTTWQKFIIVPVVFLAIYASFFVNEKFIGRPYNMIPIEKWIYQGHRFEIIEKQKMITIWTIIDKDDRLFRFPWTKEKQEKLRAARKLHRKGVPQVGQFTKKKKPKTKGKNKRDDSRDYELKFYAFPHQEIFPKDGNKPVPLPK